MYNQLKVQQLRDGMMRNCLSRLLLLGVLAGCDGSTDPIMCTRELRFGIQMEVINAESRNPSAAGATMTLNEDTYFESIVGIEDNSMLVGAPERAGTYIVTVARSGYHTWVQTDVVVTADECHVQTVSLIAELEPI